jgi:hypothetical protein
MGRHWGRRVVEAWKGWNVEEKERSGFALLEGDGENDS